MVIPSEFEHEQIKKENWSQTKIVKTSHTRQNRLAEVLACKNPENQRRVAKSKRKGAKIKVRKILIYRSL